ncbi:MAG: amidohydrolase family protein [Treponema sp.]|jgi:guanine deaminase|nr:amidohydrolase family protein [Treponema sp.]
MEERAVIREDDFVIKGDLCWSEGPAALKTMPDAFLVCSGGKSAGTFARLPAQFEKLPLIDHSGSLVIPGLVDLHMHAPQFAFRGLGMDLELLEWLSSRAFPEEAKYGDLDYARRAYSLMVEHLKNGSNTRIVFFATLHVPATILLMDLLEESGLVSMVGKVNMDRNSPDTLREENAAASLNATREWLKKCAAGNYRSVKPILTPRFIPSCSNDLMRGLCSLQREFNLPVQSHLSENRSEVEWVGQLCPSSGGYGAAYNDFGLFGSEEGEPSAPTVMAHCVWSDENEIRLMARQGVFAAHCPQSNINLSSGIAPMRRILEAGVNAGLGSDIAGGTSSSIFRAMSDAVQVSKLRPPLHGVNEKALTMEEAFFLGTKGGGAFFGKSGMGYCGSFEQGFDFDALVINDNALAAPFGLSLRDRLERAVYICDSRNITAKYVRGKRIQTTNS